MVAAGGVSEWDCSCGWTPSLIGIIRTDSSQTKAKKS